MRDAEREEVEALLGLVRARYGERLDAAQWRDVEQAVAAVVALGRALRAVPLGNADAPYPPFQPYRGEP